MLLLGVVFELLGVVLYGLELQLECLRSLLWFILRQFLAVLFSIAQLFLLLRNLFLLLLKTQERGAFNKNICQTQKLQLFPS